MELKGSGYVKPHGENAVSSDMALRVELQSIGQDKAVFFMVSEDQSYGWAGPIEDTRSENLIYLDYEQAKS